MYKNIPERFLGVKFLLIAINALFCVSGGKR